MKKYLIIMMSLFILKIANAQDNINFINPPERVYPSDEYFYVDEKIDGALWTVTNGSFDKINDLPKENTGIENFNTVYWSDAKCSNNKLPEGKIILEAFKFSTIEKVKAEHTVKILTVNNMSLGVLKASKTAIDMRVDTINVRLPSERINYYETTTKIKEFEWTLPEGWKSTNGDTGTFVLQSTSMNVITDGISEGEIKVRALNNYNGRMLAKSQYSSVQITRKGVSIDVFPKTIPFGSVATYKFSAKPLAGISFEWKAPRGWSINGGGSTYTGSNSVQITTSKCPTNEKVRVRMVKDGEVSEWTEFPTIVELPTIKVPTGQISQYQPSTFSLDMADNDIASVEWLVNGKSVGIVNNKSSLSFSIYESGKVKVSAKLTMKGCQSVNIPYAEVNVVKAPEPFISGPSTICDEATYSISNLPPDATVQWRVGDGIMLISGQGTGSIVVRNTASAKSYISADILYKGVKLSSLTKQGIYLGKARSSFILFDPSCGAIGCETESPNYSGLFLLRAEDENSLEYYWKIMSPSGRVETALQSVPALAFCPLEYGKYTISLKGRNDCGWGYETIRVYEVPSISAFIVYPNPSSDIVNIGLKNETNNNQMFANDAINKVFSSDIIEIQLWNATSLIRTYKTDQETYQFSVSDLPKGIYFIRVIKDGKIYTEKLIRN